MDRIEKGNTRWSRPGEGVNEVISAEIPANHPIVDWTFDTFGELDGARRHLTEPWPNSPFLRCCYCPDFEHWQKGFNDQIFDAKHKVEWTHLQVDMAKVVASSVALHKFPTAPADNAKKADDGDAVYAAFMQPAKAFWDRENRRYDRQLHIDVARTVDGFFSQQRDERRFRIVKRIEQRLEAQVFKDRTYFRVSKIVDRCVLDNDPAKRAAYFKAFELAVIDDFFNEGMHQRSQLFCTDAAPPFFMRLTKERLATYLGGKGEVPTDASGRSMDPAGYRARKLERLAERAWMPHRFIRAWLNRYGLPDAPWLEDRVPGVFAPGASAHQSPNGPAKPVAQPDASTERPATGMEFDAWSKTPIVSEGWDVRQIYDHLTQKCTLTPTEAINELNLRAPGLLWCVRFGDTLLQSPPKDRMIRDRATFRLGKDETVEIVMHPALSSKPMIFRAFRDDVLAMWPVAQPGASMDRAAIGATKDETISPESEQGSDRAPGRQRLAERPLGANGRPNTVTAAWDTIGLHPEWVTKGLPPHWSERTAGQLVNVHFRAMIRQGKIAPDNYDYLKPNEQGQYKISDDSVERALVPRRPPRT